jgi:hypothetical protein
VQGAQPNRAGLDDLPVTDRAALVVDVLPAREASTRSMSRCGSMTPAVSPSLIR